MRLDKVSSEMFKDFSRTQLKKWILEGRILLNSELALPKDNVHVDDVIEINPTTEKKNFWEPEDICFDVMAEEKDYLIINKPSNLIMHPGAGSNNGTLANGLLYKYPELENIPRAGIVHRLDKDTSGVLLVARTEKFRNYFVQELQERKVKKNYIAAVVGKIIGSLAIDDPIGRDKNNRTKMSIRPDGKEAYSFIRLEEDFNNYSLLDVSIKTGRTHQIRVHLASKKLPIIGDKTYNPSGNIAKNTPKELIYLIRNFPRQALHSSKLSFVDPETHEDISFNAPIPQDIKNLISQLKKHI
tara:strand:+ start:204 stop:1100 length:897 start_codon:yes stop_codon:yes gene_type:complete